MDTFQVRSESRPGQYHTVHIDGDQDDCSCEAASYYRACRHVRIARELMAAEIPDRELWLTPDIINRLGEPLDPSRIVTFEKGPQRGTKYLEGHDVVLTANRIFGYGNWAYRLMGMPVMVEEGVQGTNATPYQVWTAIVEVTVAGCEPFVELGTNTRQGNGSASLEMAIKGAVTDGFKRCLKNFGDQFGLVLYDKDNEYWDGPQDRQWPAENTPEWEAMGGRQAIPQRTPEPRDSGHRDPNGPPDWDAFWKWAKPLGHTSQSLGGFINKEDMRGATEAQCQEVVRIVTEQLKGVPA